MTTIDINFKIKQIPKELQKYIISYLSFQTETAKLIQNISKYYEIDHSWPWTKSFRKYYIKNIIPFYIYVFDSKSEPEEYEYGPLFYDVNYIQNKFNDLDEFEYL